MTEAPRFRPQSAASRWQLVGALLLAGPLLWLAALVVPDVVLERTDAVWIRLVVALASFALGLIRLVPVRRHRLRVEREG